MIKKTGHYLILPFYHIVTDEDSLHIDNLYQPRSVQKFKDDLDFLLENYTSISLQELMTLNKEEKNSDKNYFHLTFDDGLREFYTTVAPILKEKGVYATVFLNSNFIDNKELFYRFKASILYNTLKDESLFNVPYHERTLLDDLASQHGIDFDDYLKKEQPYLTSDQIKELQADGFTFGAHSENHPLYKDLDLTEQLDQTKRSIKAVVDNFNLDYKVFSFPFTDDGVSKAFFDEISDEVDCTFGCAGIKEDNTSKHFQRIPMESDKTGKEIIKAEYLYYLMKEKAGKHKIVRQ